MGWKGSCGTRGVVSMAASPPMKDRSRNNPHKLPRAGDGHRGGGCKPARCSLGQARQVSERSCSACSGSVLGNGAPHEFVLCSRLPECRSPAVLPETLAVCRDLVLQLCVLRSRVLRVRSSFCVAGVVPGRRWAWLTSFFCCSCLCLHS